MTSSPLKIAVIVGSTRPNRFSEKPAQWIFEEAKKREGVEVELLDLRDYPLPMFEEPVSLSMNPRGQTHPVAKEWSKKIDAADAYIIVTPEYNHGISGVLKNALDYAFHEWHNKAVGFVAYGSVGGARAVEHLRLVAIELHMASVRNSVHIPGSFVFGGAPWNPTEDASLRKAADGMLTQLLWWAHALKEARMKTV